MAVKISGMVFDIGGVLVENPNYENFWKDVKGSKELRVRFGRGKIGEKDFIRRGSKLMNLSQKMFYEKYKEAYWTGELIQPIFDVYQKLKITRFIFSDTNAIHLRYLKKNFGGIFKLAKKSFVGLRKEKKGSFEKVIKAIGIPPTELLFVDDKHENILRAQRAGMNAILYTGRGKFILALKKYGIVI